MAPHTNSEREKKRSMKPFFVDHNGVPLDSYKPPKQAPNVVETPEDLPLDVIAAREAERQSTKKHHPFTQHHTYTGSGCAICGRDEPLHPQ